METEQLEAMYTLAVERIQEFALKHPDETFYAFAICEDMLCLNSEEEFQMLAQSWSSPPSSPEELEKQRFYTANWFYQGFAELPTISKLYADHDVLSDEEQLSSDYRKVVDSLLERLAKEQDSAFGKLKRSPDFRIFYQEHVY